jgi:endogenous inhibitor of DNA gyrase (YacG/DUF329 family)
MKQVPCPRCGQAAPFSPENKWRPFCSERCKMADLGRWLTGSYSVPDEPPPEPDPETQ